MPILKSIRDFVSRKSYWGLIPSTVPGGKYNWGATEFLKANEISLYVNKAIEKRAEKVGQIQFVLKRGDKEITEDPRLNILYRPNSYYTGAEFWALYQKYKDLTGEAYIYMVRGGKLFETGKVKELILLRPDLVEHVYDQQTGELTKFIYHPNGARIEYKPEEIVYSFRPNPLDPRRGISLLKAGARTIETDRQISEYQVNVLKNGGKVESVFKFKTALTKTQLDELEKGYNEKYAGAAKAGKPLFLGGDADYIRMGLNPEELAYLETKNVTLNDICILTGVPKSVLASVDDVKFDNADASWKIFLRETIKPELQALATKLDLTLFGDAQDLDLSFIDPTPEDTKALIEKVKAGHEVNALTINEKREMLGFDPLPDGEVILVPFSSTTLDSVLNPPEPEPAQDSQDIEKSALQHPLKDPYIRKKYGELYIKRFDRREEALLKLIRKYFRGQEQRLIEKLKETRAFKKQGLIDDMFAWEKEIKLAVDEFIPFLTKVLEESGEDVMKLVGSTQPFRLSLTLRGWLDNKVKIFSETINDTTFKTLQDEFAESLEAGETRQELIKRIQTTYGNIGESRAKTIARTEIQGASQKGQFEGYKQAGMKIKIWVATLDHRTRHAHGAADGQEVPIDMPFNVGGESLMFPGDPNGSAENVINCRCTC
jgi:HK97 family phage portal protein